MQPTNTSASDHQNTAQNTVWHMIGDGISKGSAVFKACWPMFLGQTLILLLLCFLLSLTVEPSSTGVNAMNAESALKAAAQGGKFGLRQALAIAFMMLLMLINAFALTRYLPASAQQLGLEPKQVHQNRCKLALKVFAGKMLVFLGVLAVILSLAIICGIVSVISSTVLNIVLVLAVLIYIIALFMALGISKFLSLEIILEGKGTWEGCRAAFIAVCCKKQFFRTIFSAFGTNLIISILALVALLVLTCGIGLLCVTAKASPAAVKLALLVIGTPAVIYAIFYIIARTNAASHIAGIALYQRLNARIALREESSSS